MSESSTAKAREDSAILDWLEAHTYHGKQSPSKWGNGLAVHQVQDIWTKPGLDLRQAVKEQLAHQQPSAPTADVEFSQIKGVDLRPTYEELEAIAAARFDTIMELREARAPLVEELELAWGIIANAHGGDWKKASTEWQDAAAKWRDRVMPALTGTGEISRVKKGEVVTR